MLIFSQTFSTKGQQGKSLLDRHCRGKTCFSTQENHKGPPCIHPAALVPTIEEAFAGLSQETYLVKRGTGATQASPPLRDPDRSRIAFLQKT